MKDHNLASLLDPSVFDSCPSPLVWALTDLALSELGASFDDLESLRGKTVDRDDWQRRQNSLHDPARPERLAPLLIPREMVAKYMQRPLAKAAEAARSRQTLLPCLKSDSSLVP